jgi:hypothetical protein
LSDLAAGRVTTWLAEMRAALAGTGEATVPCQGCVACCAASQFVHIGPDEADALAAIPSELLFPAPGKPPGHVVMGYDDRGRCPMLGEHGCTIYEHRPRTCRTYDCRVFAAAGVRPDNGAIAERVERWRFEIVDDADRDALASVRAAAAATEDPSPMRRAVRAVER